MEDVAPRRRRAQRSPTPTKQKRSPHSPHHRESKREEKNSKKKKQRKRSPSSPSSSPSSSLDEGSGYSCQERQRRGHRRSYAAWKRSSKLKKFKEGGKNISFLTYDGTFGAIDKVLAFIQQFDAAFGDEGFPESSKLRHVAMHFQKSARQWWASLQANGEAPKTWKALRASIMKQFLASDANDKVLTEWRSLKLSPYESIHKYLDKFWDLHLKATFYKKIDFEEQKHQFYAGLPEDMKEYVNSQRPRSISEVIHHTMVAARINFQQGAKRNLQPMEVKEKQEYKGKNFSQNSSKGNSNNNKAKEEGVFKGGAAVRVAGRIFLPPARVRTRQNIVHRVSSKLTDLFFKSLSKHGSSEKAHERQETKKPPYCNAGIFRKERGEIPEYAPGSKDQKRIKHLSSTANSVAGYSAKVLSTTVDKLWHEFNQTAQAAGKEHLENARSFLECCCFKAFSILTSYEDHLYDINFRRYTFDCMVAWETPTASQPSSQVAGCSLHLWSIYFFLTSLQKDDLSLDLQDDNVEPRAKEEEDDDASLFYTDLLPMLVDFQDTFGIDAFVRIAPRIITIVADTVTAYSQFETLTAPTSGRMPFPVYDKYLGALGKHVKELSTKQESVHVHNLPVTEEELVLEVDGMSQTVIQHVGSKAFSGRLTLTDHALYFEQSSIMSYRDAVKFSLAADLDHEVTADLSGPWGSRIFDKAITYKNSSLDTPIMFEFPDLIGSTRRDYWLALIQEIVDCHMFIRKYHLEESSQSEAIARAVLGIIRLQAMRDCIQVLPTKPGALLVYSSAEGFLSWGDLVLEALANAIKNATMHAEEEAKSAFDKSDGSIAVPNSAVRLLQCLLVWQDSKSSVFVYRVKPGELTPLERAVIEARNTSKQTQKVKALEEDVKLDGMGTNIAVMNELLKPVIAFALWLRDVLSWNRPLETFHFAVILAYIIYKITNKAAKYQEIVVQSPSGVSLDQVVTAQRAISQLQGILQATTVVLLKTWALALSVNPEATNLLVCVVLSLALVLALIPFKVLALAIHVAIFISTIKNRTSGSKLHRRLRELWHSIPPLSVCLVESDEEKNIREALQG
ncbi:hypothetical protein L7F22_025519 [Adiantum nelumboides]|nr:hypothetical protein [Adiantum nelumboides]